jgi:hypothetical protein
VPLEEVAVPGREGLVELPGELLAIGHPALRLPALPERQGGDPAEHRQQRDHRADPSSGRVVDLLVEEGEAEDDARGRVEDRAGGDRRRRIPVWSESCVIVIPAKPTTINA